MTAAAVRGRWRLCGWCAAAILLEAGLYASYRGHDARFHWFTHFFVGAATAKVQSLLYLTGTFYLTMVAAGYVFEAAFGLLHLVPSGRHAKVTEAAITWNYTTFLNLIAIAFTAALLVRFVRTVGAGMLKMMGGDPTDGHDDPHQQQHQPAAAHAR